MHVVAIVGHQGSGKTTLIERLIPALKARGLRVSTVKHTHHHHIELDVVLVEGFKQLEGLKRVEVFRGPGEPLASRDPGIAAVAVPAGVRLAGYRGVTLPLDDTEAVLEFVLKP